MNHEITEKIKKLRISKGFNHTDMADKLHITRSAYQRLESGETYSWAKYLDELLDIFDTTPKDFFTDIGKRVIHQTVNDNAIGYVETLHQENKEVYEKLIVAKDDQISLLKEQLVFMKEQLKR